MEPLASIKWRVTKQIFRASNKPMPSFVDKYYSLEFFACYWALVDNINVRYQVTMQLELSCNLLLNVNVV